MGGGFAGYCDWLLPDHVRLQTILLEPFVCGTTPCVDPVFDNAVDSFTAASFYWSSTSVASRPVFAWFVDFFFGDLGGLDMDIGGSVRAVRRGR